MAPPWILLLLVLVVSVSLVGATVIVGTNTNSDSSSKTVQIPITAPTIPVNYSNVNTNSSNYSLDSDKVDNHHAYEFMFTTENATIVRAGSFNCSSGYVLMNITANSSGVFGKCVTLDYLTVPENATIVRNMSRPTLKNLNVSGDISKIGSPTNGLTELLPVEGNYYSADAETNHTYRIYAYKYINGMKIYSPSFTTASYYDDGTLYDYYTVNVSWTAVSGADGYKLLKYYWFDTLGGGSPSMQYDYFVETNISSYRDYDIGQWKAGNSIVPTTGYTNTINLGGVIRELYVLDKIHGNYSNTGTVNFESPIYFFGAKFMYGDTVGKSTTLGIRAGEKLGSALYSTFVGYNAGVNISAQSYNTFVGSGAGEDAVLCMNSEAIGVGALKKCNSGSSTAIGVQSLEDLDDGYAMVGVGYGTFKDAISSTNGVCVGYNGCSGVIVANNIIGIGANTVSSNLDNQMMLGGSATAWKKNQIVIGNAYFPFNDTVFGGQSNVKHMEFTIRAMEGYSTNSVGSNMTIDGGYGTGTGTAGVVKIRTSDKVGSGTTLQTPTTKLMVSDRVDVYGNLVVSQNFSAKRPYWTGYDNSTQAFASTASAQIINISNNADLDSYGIRVKGNQNLTFDQTGDYLCLLTPEFYQATGSNKIIQFWMQKNGRDVNWTNSQYTMTNGEYNAPLIPFQFDITNPTTDTIRFMWYSDSTSSQIITIASGTAPYRPGVPGVILNCQKVSEIT